MAIVSVTESGSSQGGTTNDQGVTTHTRSFIVEVDSALDSEVTVLSSFLLPQEFQWHPDDWFARVKSRNAKRRSGTYTIWDVEVEYSSETEDQEDPTLQVQQVSWSFAQFTKPVEKAYLVTGGSPAGSKTPVTNSAGDPFDPTVEMDDSRPVVSVSRKQLFVPTFILTYKDKVNDAALTIDGIAVGAREAKLQDIRVGPKQQEKAPSGIIYLYRDVNIEIALRRETWDFVIADMGTHDFDATRPAGEQHQHILVKDSNKNDMPVSSPIHLNGSGKKLAEDQKASNTFFYRTYRAYDEADFSLLGLPP